MVSKVISGGFDGDPQCKSQSAIDIVHAGEQDRPLGIFFVHGFGLGDKLIKNLFDRQDVVNFIDILAGKNQTFVHITISGQIEPLGNTVDVVAFLQTFIDTFLRRPILPRHS